MVTDMKFAKKITIFLMDGDPSGRLTCELSNWTGKAYKIPRIAVKDCSDRTELQSTGVYLLLGRTDEGAEKVYIGEAESILKRLIQHLSGKEFWYEAIVFISKDENLNKAHIKYLEFRLFELANKAARYEIENTVTPSQSSISEADEAEMEEFLENIKLLVSTLGHKVFDEKREHQSKRKSEIFSIKAARGANAQGHPTSEGFVVYKGSKAAQDHVSSFPPSMKKMVVKLIDKGVLKKGDDEYLFTEDYIFSSPSTAAAIVMGRNANGWLEWKLKDGKTLKAYETIDE